MQVWVCVWRCGIISAVIPHWKKRALLWPIVALVIVMMAEALFAVDSETRSFRAPVQMPREVVKGFLWLEAEGFAEYGGWRIDTQFVHKMGSAYLLAAGVQKPIGRARTRISISATGSWTVWARTKDWLPEYHPGTFRILVDGRPGRRLGCSGQDGWRWEKAGSWELKSGGVTLELEDLSGSFARCDALLLTTETNYLPPDAAEACARERARLTGVGERLVDGGAYDFVVVGAGPGGLSAAIAAARHGVGVMLVHDRPILGGNASSELGVPTVGAAISHVNAREGGLCEEANLARVGTDDGTLSAAFHRMTDQLPNLTICNNSRVEAVEKDGACMTAVLARDTLTGHRTRYRGKLFLDGTGDGWIGRFAGASLLYGREARSEYGEHPAPESGDEMLMSGCLMDNYLGYRHRPTDHAKVPYQTPEWARVLPEGFTRRVANADSQWWVEHSGRFNEVTDPERARDELVRINLAYWGWLKNEWEHKERIASHELSEMAHMIGRREGYRILGDYVLTGNDCLEGRIFADRISYGGWPLDRHDPLGMENPNGDGYCAEHPEVPIYSIPFRILYSKDVPNLMMAGRNVSATHVALGSVRVESTIMGMGQAAGTAVALMLTKGLLPREFGANDENIRMLQQALLKDDQYIPCVSNTDSNDLARSAKVTASSIATAPHCRMMEPTVYALEEFRRELTRPLVTCLPMPVDSSFRSFECLLESASNSPRTVGATLYESADMSGSSRTMNRLAATEAVVAGGRHGVVKFELQNEVKTSKPYVWLVLDCAKGISWRRAHRAQSQGLACGEWGGGGVYLMMNNRAYSFLPEDGRGIPLDTKPEYVVDGVSRPVGRCVHGWVSDPNVPLPQSISLQLSKAEKVSEVRITFDSDLMPLHPARHPVTLVRAYRIEGLQKDGTWQVLADEYENLLRHRVHGFTPKMLTEVRIVVLSTWGDPSARIFEVRLY